MYTCWTKSTMQTEKPDALAAEILLGDDIVDNLNLLRDTLTAERFAAYA